MTSKISCIKLIKEDLRQRTWLIAILSTVTFLFQPLMLIIGINEKTNWINTVTPGFTMKDFKFWLFNFMGFNNNALVFCVILFAILCGVSGFYYLHSKEKLNLIHSLPIRRERLFFIQFVSGFLIFLIPFTLNLLVSMLSISFQGYMSLELLKVSFTAFGIHVLFFLLLYTLTVFSMIMTGKLLIGLIVTLSLFSYGTLIVALFRLLAIRFFSTYFLKVDAYWFSWFKSLYITTDGADGLSSPLLAYISTLNQMSDQTVPYKLILFSVIGTIVFLLLGIFLYRLRPTETAGKPIAFPKAESVLKILLSIPLGICAAFYLDSLANQTSNNIVIFILAILCTFIFAIVIEFIYTMDLKHLFAKKGALLLSVILAFGITAIYKFDLFKYDNYIPKKNEIESIAIYMDDFNTRFYCPITSNVQSTKDFLDSSALKDFGPVYQLAQKGASLFDMTDETAQYVNLKYNLKNGRSVYRMYLINETDVQNCSKYLLNNQQYKEALFQTNLYSSLDFQYVEVTDIYQSTSKLNISAAQMKTLLDIYQKDLVNASYFDLTSQFPSGTINFAPKNSSDTYMRPLFCSFTNTYDYLKELGYDLPTKIESDNVQRIEATNHDNQKNIVFNTPEDIAKILPKLTSVPYYFYKKPIEFIVTFKSNIYSSSNLFYLNSEQIPDCLKDLLN